MSAKKMRQSEALEKLRNKNMPASNAFFSKLLKDTLLEIII